MKAVAIVEARLNSNRLPGKVLLPIGSECSLGHIYQRLRCVTKITDICIATTNNKSDDAIVEWSKSRQISVYRGSEYDVLSRVLSAAESLSAEVIVEITGDCPFVDPIIVEQYLDLLIGSKLDYVSNNIVSSYPDGFDVQVFLTKALKKSNTLAKTPAEREHVTMHIRQNPEIFRTLNIFAPTQYQHPEMSVTLDTEEDLEVLRLISAHFTSSRMPNHMEIIEFLLANPDIVSINSKIRRKGYGI